MSHHQILPRATALACLCTTALGGVALAQEVETLRFGVAVSASLSQAPVPMLELDTELQAKHNIHIVTHDFMGNVNACMAAVIAGDVDICQNGISIGMNAMAEGADLVSVMQLIGQINEITLTPAAIARIGVPADAPIADRVAALDGLSMAGPNPGSTTYAILEEILKEADLTPANLTYQPLNDLTALNALIGNERVDAAMWSVGGLSPAHADGTGVRYINLAANDIPRLATIPNVASFAPADFVAENRDMLARVQAALVDVVAALRADPFTYAAPYKAKYLPDLDPAIWEDNLPQAVSAYFSDLEGTREGWDFWAERLENKDPEALARVSYEAGYVRLSD